MSMRKTTIAVGQLLRSVHMEKLPRQGRLPDVVQRVTSGVTRLSNLPRGSENLMWTVTGVRR